MHSNSRNRGSACRLALRLILLLVFAVASIKLLKDGRQRPAKRPPAKHTPDSLVSVSTAPADSSHLTSELDTFQTPLIGEGDASGDASSAPGGGEAADWSPGERGKAEPAEEESAASLRAQLDATRAQLQQLQVDRGNTARHLEHSLRERAAAYRAAAASQAAGAADAEDQEYEEEAEEAEREAAAASADESAAGERAAEGCTTGPADVRGVVAAVVTVTFDRPDYLTQHLDSLLSVHGRDANNRRRFPLHIAQDGGHPGVARIARALERYGIKYLNFRGNDAARKAAEEAPPTRKQEAWQQPHKLIGAHYRFIFAHFFDCLKYPRLLILEDDMQLAIDFFPYFRAMAPLLDSDPTLYCVSSWNDNGQEWNVRNQTAVRRTDFFPGLGWMTSAHVWASVRTAFLAGHYWTWDDYLRTPSVRKGRQCLQPEVCRNFNFGAQGSSKGQFYAEHLQPVRLAVADVDWAAHQLSYLQPEAYTQLVRSRLAGALLVGSAEEAAEVAGDARIEYDSMEGLTEVAKALGWFAEWREGTPRGAFAGVLFSSWRGGTPAKPVAAALGAESAVERSDSGWGRASVRATAAAEGNGEGWDADTGPGVGKGRAAEKTIFLVPKKGFSAPVGNAVAERYVAEGRTALQLDGLEALLLK